MRATWRVRSRSATALARQSARSAGDTRAEAATVRRSAIRTRRHDEMGASPPARELRRSAGSEGDRRGAEPPLASPCRGRAKRGPKG